MDDTSLTDSARPDAGAAAFARNIWTALGGDPAWLSRLGFTGEGDLPSVFPVTDLAAGAVAAAGLAIAEATGGSMAGVDRRLASFWFSETIQPQGWSLPPAWDPIAGDYQAADGWIRLHTNAVHHREAALRVLNVPGDKAAVAAAAARWRADDLEAAVVAAGGCAATMRDTTAWRGHPHGASVAAEPLVWIDTGNASASPDAPARPDRPLAGVRVLDLTRVLAGPVATRFLAGFGADVLRIDPPWWDEPSLAPSVTLGKRCARLDLRQPGALSTFRDLLAEADILVHGYRPDALARLGLDAEARRALRPGLIDVSHDAYGWTGPWRGRRGFDSLVQMSSGIAAEGMRRFATDRPKPLPVQALDHATGYIVAAAAIRGLTARRMTGIGGGARTSLARVAALLTAAPAPGARPEPAPPGPDDFNPAVEATPWGPALRLSPPVSVEGAPMRWDRPACELGSSEPVWLPR